MVSISLTGAQRHGEWPDYASPKIQAGEFFPPCLCASVRDSGNRQSTRPIVRHMERFCCINRVSEGLWPLTCFVAIRAFIGEIGARNFFKPLMDGNEREF